jgi:hypothetical protein
LWAMDVDDRYILVRLGRFCLRVNGTAIVVSINLPLQSIRSDSIVVE